MTMVERFEGSIPDHPQGLGISDREEARYRVSTDPHVLRRRPKVTINTVAESARVSRQTVTNALLHPERVHPDTLLRVRSEIIRLGYRPSAAAQSLRAQRAGPWGWSSTCSGRPTTTR